MNTFYKRNLPHFQPGEGKYFCTFRLVNSLPKQALIRYKQERERRQKEFDSDMLSRDKKKGHNFYNFDTLLTKFKSGNNWLREQKVAKIVADKLHEYDSMEYSLRCYCIMPNHVHLLIRLKKRDKSRSTESGYPLTKILKLIKGGTAFEANKILERQGQFWQHESYDHFVRNDQEQEKIIRYILQNPVMARLIKHWEDWPWTFCKKEYLPLR